MQVRKSQKNDLNTLSTWFDNQLDVNYWGGPLISFPIDVETLKSEIQWSENLSYSLIKNGKLIGFAQVANKFNCNHICRVLIKPGFRGKQLGKMLMESIFMSNKSNTKNYSLFVYKSNNVALNLYKNLGFTVHQHPEGQSHLGECIFMIKRLNDTI